MNNKCNTDITRSDFKIAVGYVGNMYSALLRSDVIELAMLPPL